MESVQGVHRGGQAGGVEWVDGEPQTYIRTEKQPLRVH